VFRAKLAKTRDLIGTHRLCEEVLEQVARVPMADLEARRVHIDGLAEIPQNDWPAHAPARRVRVEDQWEVVEGVHVHRCTRGRGD
jgi:hypothetical protein